jgi:uncharacterized protein (DUF2147 family)
MLAVLLLAAASPARADDPQAVIGFWATEDSILEVSPAGDSLSMRVVAMENPVYLEGEAPGPAGAPRVDVNNPDPARRDQLIMGLELLSDYEFAKERWRGRIYDPQSGNVYKSTMWVEDGALNMRGFIGFSLLGRTQTFTPVAACGEDVRALMAAASFDGVACD